MTKEAEARVREITNLYLWHRHKYGDVRYCPVCHAALPKTENAPDFYIGFVGEWVEAKNNDATGAWNCSEIMEGGARVNQRNFLNREGGWLFIEFSEGRKPEEKAAYLIPWGHWLSNIEPRLQSMDMKSIRRLTTYNQNGEVRRFGADILFAGYSLTWVPRIGWTIPSNHIWWFALEGKLEQQLRIVREERHADQDGN